MSFSSSVPLEVDWNCVIYDFALKTSELTSLYNLNPCLEFQSGCAKIGEEVIFFFSSSI